MPKACASHVAGLIVGLATLLASSLACAADGDRPHVAVERVQPKAKSKLKAASKKPGVKQIAQKVVLLPVEIAGLFIGQGLTNPTFAGQRITTAFVDAQGRDISSTLLLPTSSLSRQPDTLEVDLSEARMAVWLSNDLNLQCDLDRDPAIARGDQFAVRFALQFRFR